VQVFACSRGLREVVPVGVLELFSAVELQAMLGGAPAVSNARLADWKKHCEYGPGFEEAHPQVLWFWEVHACVQAYMRTYLHACMHTYIHLYACMCMGVRVRVHAWVIYMLAWVINMHPSRPWCLAPRLSQCTPVPAAGTPHTPSR
jgi:hypothetical protein